MDKGKKNGADADEISGNTIMGVSDDIAGDAVDDSGEDSADGGASEDAGEDSVNDLAEDVGEDSADDSAGDAEDDENEDATEGTDDIAGSADDDIAEDKKEEEDTDDGVSRGAARFWHRDPAYNRLLPISLLAGLIGLLLGSIPAVLFTLISNSANVTITGDITSNTFYPLFVATPLIIYLFNKLLKGGRDIRAIIVTAVFSLVSAYLTALLCIMVTLNAVGANMTALQILIEVTSSAGSLDYFSISDYASAYAYPLVFTALGVVIAALLLRGTRKANAELEDDEDAECTDEDEGDAECTDGDEESAECTDGDEESAECTDGDEESAECTDEDEETIDKS